MNGLAAINQLQLVAVVVACFDETRGDGEIGRPS